jgi:hypothetical protein
VQTLGGAGFVRKAEILVYKNIDSEFKTPKTDTTLTGHLAQGSYGRNT